jgi:hypothetical protein
MANEGERGRGKMRLEQHERVKVEVKKLGDGRWGAH